MKKAIWGGGESEGIFIVDAEEDKRLLAHWADAKIPKKENGDIDQDWIEKQANELGYTILDVN